MSIEELPTDTEISGIVESLNCQRPTFSAGKMWAGGRRVSFSVRGYLKIGDTAKIGGVWERHPTYGPQFKGRTMELTLPVDPAGLVKWLMWNAPAVGPIKAQKMVDEFGDRLMDLCVSDPQQVAVAAKLPITSVEYVAKKWAAEAGKVGAMSWLAANGLTQSRCEKVVKELGQGAVSLIKDDPYILISKVDGFGWSVTDSLAKKIGMTDDDPRRLRGALAAVVTETYESTGSTCVTVDDACKLVCDRIGIQDINGVLGVVQEACDRNTVARFGGDTEFLATPDAIRAERFTFEFLRRSHFRNPLVAEPDPERVAELYRRSGTVTLDDEQVAAVANALKYRFSVMTGGAGCGKSQTTKSIVKAFEDSDVDVFLCAPTGKAARRMKEIVGRDAVTIHRLLEYNGGTFQFGRNESNQLPPGVVIVDEASMVDAAMLYRLLSAIGPRGAVVLVGDPNQLPPVGAGSPLRDILENNLAPTVRLEKVHRQAGHLKTNSVDILKGKVSPTVTDYTGSASPWVLVADVDSAEKLKQRVIRLYREKLSEWGFDPVEQTQFMTAQHGGGYGTRRINGVLQWLHQTATGNPVPEPDIEDEDYKPILLVNDKVIQTKNDYDLNVMNGEIGVVVAVSPTREALRRLVGIAPLPSTAAFAPGTQAAPGYEKAVGSGGFDPKKVVADYVVKFVDRTVVFPIGTGGNLELAYCLSVHKMQGSQVQCAVVVCPKAHRFMQNRSWLYTAVTRAQKTCVVIGDKDGIRFAVEKVVRDGRQTVIQVLVKETHEKLIEPTWSGSDGQKEEGEYGGAGDRRDGGVLDEFDAADPADEFGGGDESGDDIPF